MKIKTNYTILPDELLRDDRLNIIDAVLWGRLYRFAGNGTRMANPSKKRLANELGCSVKTVERSIKSLSDYGFISVERNNLGQNNEFTILYPWTEKVSEVVVEPKKTKPQVVSWDKCINALTSLCEGNEKMFGKPNDDVLNQAIESIIDNCKAWNDSPEKQIEYINRKFKEGGAKWLFIYLVVSLANKDVSKSKNGVDVQNATQAYDSLCVNQHGIGITECVVSLKETAGYCNGNVLAALGKISRKLPDEDNKSPESGSLRDKNVERLMGMKNSMSPSSFESLSARVQMADTAKAGSQMLDKATERLMETA